jgi:hypothetical protein
MRRDDESSESRSATGDLFVMPTGSNPTACILQIMKEAVRAGKEGRSHQPLERIGTRLLADLERSPRRRLRINLAGHCGLSELKLTLRFPPGLF